MHKHDPDTMAALADGTLEDQTGARALIAKCDECRAEYETQRAVLSALSAIEPAAMTETERAAFHRDLWTALRFREAPRPVRPWWYRLSYAAAGLFVVIGVAAIISQTGGDQVAETFAELSAGSDVGAADETVGDLQADTTRAAGTAPTYAAAAPQAVFDFAASAESVRSDPDILSPYSAEDGTIEVYGEESECVDQSGIEGQRIVDAIGNYILVVPDGVEIGPDTPITFIERITCTVFHIEE